MKTLISLLIFSATFAATAAYADVYHIVNKSKTDNIIAMVYFNGDIEGTFLLKPGQQYTRAFWHNLVLNVTLINPKTGENCGLAISERPYEQVIHFSGGKYYYEPRVLHQYNEGSCKFDSTFKQSSWFDDSQHHENFTTVDVWAPWQK